MDRFAWLFSGADPFVTRLAWLALFFAAAALVDLAIHRRRATRWREYAAIVALGAVGALAGMVVDAATVAISPDYFVYGKGLVRGATLTREAMALGARAGFILGAIAAGLLCMANGRASEAAGDLPLVAQRRVARAGLLVLLPVLLLAPLFGAVACLLPLPAPHVQWSGPPTLARRFVVVWWIHLGVYVGALLGVVRGIVAIRRERNGKGVR